MFLPEPIPEDVTMSFGAFARKHELEAIIPTITRLNTEVGDLLTMPMVENLRVIGLSLVKTLGSGFLTTEKRANRELYARAQEELLAQQEVLLQSEVVTAEQSEQRGVRLLEHTPQGARLVIAKRLLVTIPPKLEWVGHLDLSGTEKSLFSRFVNAGYYTSILRDTGIPTNLSVYNAEPHAPFNLPSFPGVYSILASGVRGLHAAYYCAPRTQEADSIPDETVRAALLQSVLQLPSSNPAIFPSTKPEMVAYPSSELQGHREWFLSTPVQSPRTEKHVLDRRGVAGAR